MPDGDRRDARPAEVGRAVAGRRARGRHRRAGSGAVPHRHRDPSTDHARAGTACEIPTVLRGGLRRAGAGGQRRQPDGAGRARRPWRGRPSNCCSSGSARVSAAGSSTTAGSTAAPTEPPATSATSSFPTPATRCASAATRAASRRWPRATAMARQLTAFGFPARNSADVVALAQSGNALAIQVLRKASARIGSLVATLVNCFNPATIVVGGPLSPLRGRPAGRYPRGGLPAGDVAGDPFAGDREQPARRAGRRASGPSPSCAGHLFSPGGLTRLSHGAPEATVSAASPVG